MVLGRAAHATLTLLFARTLDAFKMAFTARKKVRSPSTSRVSGARREPVAGSVDGDSVFRHRGPRLSLPGFFRASRPRVDPRTRPRGMLTTSDPRFHDPQIVKDDGAAPGPFEETVAQVRAARSPGSVLESFLGFKSERACETRTEETRRRASSRRSRDTRARRLERVLVNTRTRHAAIDARRFG